MIESGKPKEQHRHTSTTGMLSQQCLQDSYRWFGDTINPRDLEFLALCMCGEAGEVANVVKKIVRGSLDLHDATVKHDLVMEITDVYIYLLNIAAVLNVDLEKTYVAKRAINERRFMEQRTLRERARRDAASSD